MQPSFKGELRKQTVTRSQRSRRQAVTAASVGASAAQNSNACPAASLAPAGVLIRALLSVLVTAGCAIKSELPADAALSRLRLAQAQAW